MEEKQKTQILETKATEAEPKENQKKGKKSRKRKYLFLVMVLLVITVLGAVGLSAYSKSDMYYQTHFLPNTSINGINCSNMEVETIAAVLEAGIAEYELEVVGRDYHTGDSGVVLGVITPLDIQLAYKDTSESVQQFFEQQRESDWLSAYLQDSVFEYSLTQERSYDIEMLTVAVKSWDACQKENMIKAENAYVGEYSQESHSYEIIPETVSTELNVEKVIQLVADALDRGDTVLDVEKEGCYIAAAVTQDDKNLTKIINTANSWLGTKITYDWNGTEIVLDYEILKDWISMEKNGPVLDEEAVAKFVKEQANQYDTYGKKRNFTTTLGVELSLRSGSYGWKTDTEGETEELIQLIYQGSVIDKEPIYSSTAKQKGMSDIGNSYVEADLTHQHLYLYEKGKVVLETDFVSGSMSSTPDCVTPEGIFGITYKTTNAVLRGANYTTPVSYWMPFYGNYGMHDATWRSSFGGDIYLTDGSHGCINLPLSMASQIYQYVSTGFPVICYYYKEDPLAEQNQASGGETTPVQQEPEEEEPWEEPGENEPSTNPGTGDSSTDPGTGDSSTDPGTGDSSTNSGTEDSGTNSGNGDTNTDSGTEGSGTDPGTGDSSTNPGTEDSGTNSGNGDTNTDPGTEGSGTDPGTGDSSTNPGTEDSGTNPGNGDTNTDPGTGDPDTIPGTEEPPEESGNEN